MSSRDAVVAQVLPQIILIEDTDFQAEVTMLALAQASPPGAVQWFATAEEAIDFLTMEGAHARRPPGLPLLVLSDFHLPKRSGLDFLREVRANPQLCGLPILIMSAGASADEVALCYECGATGYIDKRTDFAAFRQKILATITFWLYVNRLPHDWRSRGAPGRPTVAIVDDDASVREAIARLLRMAGMRAETFESAEAFFASTQRTIARCVIADVNLPGMSGLDLLDRLRQEQALVPVIVVTGGADGRDLTRLRALGAGAVAFLHKPLASEQLLDAVRAAVAS